MPLGSGGGCFRQGTMVATKSGHDVAIESIKEGTTLLTHADGERFGICSDEDVTVRVTDPYLVGFSKSCRSRVSHHRMAEINATCRQ